MKVPINITVNGRRYQRDVEPRLLLVHFIRDLGGVTGTKVGCDTSQCGACTVLLDGVAVRSCTCLAVQADGSCDYDHRRACARRHAASAAGGLLEQARAAVRLLHAGDDPGVARAAQAQSESLRRRDSPRARGQHVPVHGLPEHRPRRPRSGDRHGREVTYEQQNLRIRNSAARRSPADHRERDVYGRFHAARHAPRRDAAQPARTCADQADRRQPREGGARCRPGAHRHEYLQRSEGGAVRVASAERESQRRPLSVHGQRHRPLRRRHRGGRRRRDTRTRPTTRSSSSTSTTSRFRR